MELNVQQIVDEFLEEINQRIAEQNLLNANELEEIIKNQIAAWTQQQELELRNNAPIKTNIYRERIYALDWVLGLIKHKKGGVEIIPDELSDME